MKIVIFGYKGQLGTDLMRCAQRKKIESIGRDQPECDITNIDSVAESLAASGDVDLVINAAAYTAVDRAEDDKDLAFAVNRDAAGHLAQACDRMGVPLIHISTDYVFNGMQTKPYRSEDPIDPIGVYAQSKSQGEMAVRRYLDRHMIFRTSWLFGQQGHNFVKTMLRLGKEQDTLRVIDDQIGSPTYAADLAEALLQVAVKIHRGSTDWGTYHYCNRGALTWYAFARKIFTFARSYDTFAVRDVVSILTKHYPTPAPRPHYSVLDCSRFDDTFGISRRPWEEALKEMLASLYAPAQTSLPIQNP